MQVSLWPIGKITSVPGQPPPQRRRRRRGGREHPGVWLPAANRGRRRGRHHLRAHAVEGCPASRTGKSAGPRRQGSRPGAGHTVRNADNKAAQLVQSCVNRVGLGNGQRGGQISTRLTTTYVGAAARVFSRVGYRPADGGRPCNDVTCRRWDYLPPNTGNLHFACLC